MSRRKSTWTLAAGGSFSSQRSVPASAEVLMAAPPSKKAAAKDNAFSRNYASMFGTIDNECWCLSSSRSTIADQLPAMSVCLFLSFPRKRESSLDSGSRCAWPE